MFIRKPSGNLKRKGFSQDPYLIIATVFYTASLTVSTSFQDNLLTRKSCEPLIPFGECLVGVYESQHLVYSSTSVLQYLISFTVALIAGKYKLHIIGIVNPKNRDWATEFVTADSNNNITCISKNKHLFYIVVDQ